MVSNLLDGGDEIQNWRVIYRSVTIKCCCVFLKSCDNDLLSVLLMCFLIQVFQA